ENLVHRGLPLRRYAPRPSHQWLQPPRPRRSHPEVSTVMMNPMCNPPPAGPAPSTAQSLTRGQTAYKAQLDRYALRKRSIGQALDWLDQNYTGNSKRAFRHQMDAPAWKTVPELQLRE